MVFIPCDNWKALLLTIAYRHSEIFFNRHVVAFFEAIVLTEVHNKLIMLLKYLRQILLL